MRWLCLFLLFFTSISSADETTTASTTNRRIEEQKRLSLQSTEAAIDQEKIFITPEQIIARYQEYFSYLGRTTGILKKDGVYIVQMILGTHEQFSSVDDEYQSLKSSNSLWRREDTEWDLQEPLTKGEFAFMICKAIRIKGGLHMRLFGPTPRYAIFDLVYEGVMTAGSERDSVSGREAVAIFVRASKYFNDHKNDKK